jgi:tRNA threonylcarbamoyl adenosine modification protein (Sua5/YciO/YrdC/YwlC family)/dephospho-CoA kinase
VTAAEAAQVIQNGGLVIVPTETVYGIAADAMNEAAVRRIFEVKGRPPDKPLSVLVSGVSDLETLCRDVPESAYTLAEAFWPGPLTMVLKKSGAVPALVTAGGDTVGVRCPDHETTREIIRLSAPLAAPSANPSGAPSPGSADAARRYFEGLADGVVDGGTCAVGVESTIIDLTKSAPAILRRGGLSKRAMEAALGAKIDGMTVIGLTGGTGAGKTSALRALEALGALAIDDDALYHELLQRDAELLGELNGRFPGVVSGGALDRKMLGGIVFQDEAALSDLNEIAHKYVRREVDWRIARWGGRLAAVDAVALIESGRARKCDLVVGVTAPFETRLRRVMARDKIDEQSARNRINAQKEDAFYTENCDYILRNDGGDAAEFEKTCKKFFAEIIGGQNG